MFDYDVVIVGGGPAGLAAGLHLARTGHRALLLERELLGGNLKNVYRIEGRPEFPDGIAGAELASHLASEAATCGLAVKEAEVTEIETFSSTRWVGCEGGRGYSSGVVIIASGSRFRELGVLGEAEFVGQGVIDCVPCDAGLFLGRTVAVCGGGDHALADAIHLARFAEKVIVLAPGPALDADPGLLSPAASEQKIELRCKVSLEAILGNDRVESIAVRQSGAPGPETLPVDGVVVRVGSRPNTEFLDGVVDFDLEGRVITGPDFEAGNAGLLAIGDVRAGTQSQVEAALADGAAAALKVARMLSIST